VLRTENNDPSSAHIANGNMLQEEEMYEGIAEKRVIVS